MLGDILGHVASLRWLCGSIFGMVGANTTNTSLLHKMIDDISYAYTQASASSTTYYSIHSATTRALGITPQVACHIQYRSSEDTQRTVLQLYMNNMGTLSVSLRIHFLT